MERLRGGELVGVEAGPQPGELVTEGRYAAVGRHPGATEHDDPTRLAKEWGDPRRQNTLHPADPAIRARSPVSTR
ncbi:hypothetical protein GCM10009779_69450 [Polymorphospora rubra]|uniref:Uncharacterized protein n=1 Tax=Polymorphospora rubra TaxID=338584 RepID=A0A810NDI0_9ACTN|nr:hypothetical protein Prubr_63660 [Polymorphospora rubra]